MKKISCTDASASEMGMQNWSLRYCVMFKYYFTTTKGKYTSNARISSSILTLRLSCNLEATQIYSSKQGVFENLLTSFRSMYSTLDQHLFSLQAWTDGHKLFVIFLQQNKAKYFSWEEGTKPFKSKPNFVLTVLRQGKYLLEFKEFKL